MLTQGSMVAAARQTHLVLFMFIRRKGSRDEGGEQLNKPQTPGQKTPQDVVNGVQEARKPTPSTTSAVRTTAMIGMTVKIKGDISSDENLIIEGQVDGTITLNSHELTVGQSGRVNANVSAKIIKIDGQVNGDIVGKEKIIISKTGNVRGNIIAPVVILEEGGKFKGTIDMGATSAATSNTAGELPIADFANAARAQRAGVESKPGEQPASIKHG